MNTINAYINLYKAAVTVNVVKENLQQSRNVILFYPDLNKPVCSPGMIC